MPFCPSSFPPTTSTGCPFFLLLVLLPPMAYPSRTSHGSTLCQTPHFIAWLHLTGPHSSLAVQAFYLSHTCWLASPLTFSLIALPVDGLVCCSYSFHPILLLSFYHTVFLLTMAVTNQNFIHEKFKSRLNMEKACYDSVHRYCIFLSPIKKPKD